jgi:hypothetical protein
MGRSLSLRAGRATAFQRRLRKGPPFLFASTITSASPAGLHICGEITRRYGGALVLSLRGGSRVARS